jgi:hypothetical protein
LEDVVDARPTPFVQIVDLERETSTYSYDIKLSENLQLSIDKELGQEGATFKVKSRSSTGVCGRDIRVFCTPSKHFLESQLINPGENLPDDFGKRTELAAGFAEKIRTDLEGHGEIEISTGLVHKISKFKDGHSELEAFASIHGRHDVSRSEPVISDFSVAGRLLQSTENESAGQGFEYSQHTGLDGRADLSGKKDLGVITYKQQTISGRDGSPILSKLAPKNVPEQFAGISMMTRV